MPAAGRQGVLNGRATMVRHNGRMPDENQLFLRPAKPLRYNEQNTADAGLEFIMGQIAALPTRAELAKLAFVICSSVLCLG